MIHYLLLVLLPLSLYASKILSYNIYDRSDRADLMLTFDTPYDGIIKQSVSQNKIIIKLENAQIESSKIKRVNSHFLHELNITPLENETQIVAWIAPSVKLIASKTTDAYGLRLRFTKSVATHTNSYENSNNQNDLSALPTKKSAIVSTRYYIVVGLMFIGIILLFLVKKRFEPKNQKLKDTWAFQANSPIKQEMKEHSQTPSDTNMVTIRFQKAINDTNSVVMLDFGSESYLVLMGNNNILLNRFRDNIPTTQQEFETVLQERNEELEEFLGTTESSVEQHTAPFQAYTQRAASIYSDKDL